MLAVLAGLCVLLLLVMVLIAFLAMGYAGYAAASGTWSNGKALLCVVAWLWWAESYDKTIDMMVMLCEFIARS